MISACGQMMRMPGSDDNPSGFAKARPPPFAQGRLGLRGWRMRIYCPGRQGNNNPSGFAKAHPPPFAQGRQGDGGVGCEYIVREEGVTTIPPGSPRLTHLPLHKGGWNFGGVGCGYIVRGGRGYGDGGYEVCPGGRVTATPYKNLARAGIGPPSGRRHNISIILFLRQVIFKARVRFHSCNRSRFATESDKLKIWQTHLHCPFGVPSQFLTPSVFSSFRYLRKCWICSSQNSQVCAPGFSSYT